jgi:ABC-type branched-subunit amino acid transport system substrate-binding protein
MNYIRKLLLCLFTLSLLGCSSHFQKNHPVYSGTIQKRQKTTTETIIRHPPPKKLQIDKTLAPNFLSSQASIKVGLLVPLTGEYATTGKQLFQAAQLALFMLNESRIALIPLDTKGTSFGAQDAVRKAIDKNVQLIIGPLFANSAKAIANISADAGIEFITFSNDESLIDSGALLIGLTPQQQLHRIVNYSIRKGIEDYVSIVPNNALGAAEAKVLRETISEYEGTSVLKTEIFLLNKRGKARNLRSHVRNALNAAIHTKPQRDYNQELEMYNFSPIRYPRALFLDGTTDHIHQMLSAIEKNSLFHKNKVQILGTSRLADNRILAHPMLENAVFAMLQNDRKDYFDKMYRESFGEPPNHIASLAFDSVALSATLASLSGESKFTREAITNPRGFVGVNGIFRIKSNGLPERGLSIMQIQKGKLVEIEPAPRSFFDVKEEEKED